MRFAFALFDFYESSLDWLYQGRRLSERCIFQYKMLMVGVKGNLGCQAGCGLTVSFSDHARIMLGSCSDRPRIGNDVSSVFSKFL